MYNTHMLNWFKKHFIPHEGNKNRPHFLHKKNIRNVLILVIFLEVFAFLVPTLVQINKTGGMAAVLPAVLTDLTNQERQTQNLQTLTVNPILNKAAEMKAEDMATKSYFAHTSPEGRTPWYWLNQVDYNYQYAGENLAINFTDSSDVTSAWMNSPTHRANIVKDKYTEVGTGIAIGMYEGRETVFVAQVYANPTVNEYIKKEETTKVENTLTPVATVGLPKNILGAEIVEDNKIASTTNLIEVETTAIDSTSNQIETTENSTFIEKTIASPRNSTNTIFYIIFGIIILSLLLNIFIKIKHHHPDLIINGLITLVVIGAIFVTNYYLTHRSMVVTQGIDYSSEGK